MQASVYITSADYEILSKAKPKDRTTPQYMSDILAAKAKEHSAQVIVE